MTTLVIPILTVMALTPSASVAGLLAATGDVLVGARCWRSSRHDPGAAVIHIPRPLATVMRGLSSVFAQRLCGLMHRLLSWQPKTAQTSTSQHEPTDKACDIAFHTLPQGGQEVTLTRSAC